jgi:hypothetical protein
MIPRLLPLLCLALAGCPAISDADMNERRDRDGDGFPSISFGGTDCNDEDDTVHPGAAEICDGIDNDCDTFVNADDPSMPAEEVEWVLDADGDGYGTEDVIVRTCAVLVGYVHVAGDCDDTDADEFPGQTWFLDGDGDGVGLANRVRVECARPDAHVLVSGDCDDANDQIFPAAPEICNGLVDDDCDDVADANDPNVVDAAVLYVDGDGDTYGDDATGQLTCPEVDDPRVPLGGDCNDADVTLHPGAPDPPYVGGDTNCSGDSDWDFDGDGHDLLGGETGGDDCDDVRAWVFPGAPEICDDAPNDCSDPLTWDETLEGARVDFVPTAVSTPIEWTSELIPGGSGLVSIAEDGTLYVCDQPDAAGWKGRIEITGGNVVVRAARGPGSSLLDAEYLGSNVTATGTETIVRVDGLTLINGTGASAGATTIGGCLVADAIDSVTLKDTAFVNCDATIGGGAAVSASSVTVDTCYFGGNSAQVGGGLFLQSSIDSTVAASVFELNSADASGGGLFYAALGTSDPTSLLVGCVVSENTAVVTGAGLFTEVDLTVGATAFTDNVADLAGGAIFMRGLLAPAVVTCDPSTSFARNSVYAIAIQRGTFVADSCDLALGVDDNTHADIWTASSGFEYSFDGPTKIQCTQTGCL